MNLRRAWRQTSTAILTAFAVTHGILAVRNGIAESAQQHTPTRVAFAQEYGFPLKGIDTEEDGDAKFAQLGVVTARECAERPLTVAAVRFQPTQYSRQTIADQLETLITTGYSGQWNPLTHTMTLMNDAHIWSTGHHEYKHAITFEIIREHPEFKTQWKRLAIDDAGESMYRAGAGKLKRLRGISELVVEDRIPTDMLRERGFVSEYAMTDFYEDTAELGEWAAQEAYSGGSITTTARYVLQHPEAAITRKTELAEQYGLIPAHFLEYLSLKQEYFDTSTPRHGGTLWPRLEDGDPQAVAAKQFLEDSRRFIATHANSSLVAEVQVMRSFVYETNVWRGEPWATQADIVRERFAAMTAPLVADSYVSLLGHLSRQASTAYGDERIAQVFDIAQREYWRRFNAGDVRLARNGVNDVLAAQGALAWMAHASSGDVIPVLPKSTSIEYPW